MSGSIGQGDLVFGTLAAEMEAEPGFTIDGGSTVAVKCTPASSTTGEQYGAGNMTDYGGLTGTLIVDTTTIEADLDTLQGTTATLTYTYPLKVLTNSTPATITGTAIFLKAPETAAVNDIVRGAAEFWWTAKPTRTIESA